MKIVVLGDTHFGGGFAIGKNDPNTHLNTRLLDFSNTFDHVISHMIDNGIHHFFITGDIFEHRRPQASELNLFAQKLQKLSEFKIHTYIVIGNHDLIKEQSTTTLDLFESLKLPFVHIFTDINGITCSENDDSVNVIFLPFRTREMLDCSSNDEAVARTSAFLKYEAQKLNSSIPTIVIGHLMIQGTMIGNTVLESSPGEVVLPPDIFKGMAGVIMGHVHPHAIVKKKPFIVHLGSMECKDFGEGKHKKYFLISEIIGNKINYCFEQLPIRNLFDIFIDQSPAENGKEATDGVVEYIKRFSKENKLDDSIVRIEIAINDKCLYDLNRETIKQTLKQFKVNHCVGIYPQIVSKRQLRKSTITEHNDPLVSFTDYVELEEDTIMREKMKQVGSKIITDRGK